MAMTAARPAPGLVCALSRLGASRDPAAWAELVEAVGDDIARACASVAGRELGRDAAQECLIRVRDRAGRFRAPDTGDAEAAARAWIRRVATTTALELMRARGRAAARDARAQRPDDGPDPADGLARRERDGLVRAALVTLPADQREAVALHHVLDLPLAQVAAAQGIAIEAAKKRVQRGVERLRQRLLRLGCALSLPALGQALDGLRADAPDFHRDHALAALAAPPAPAAIGWLKGAVVSIIIGLPAVIVFALVNADDGTRSALPVGSEPPPSSAQAAYPEVTVAFQDTSIEDAAAQLALLSGMRIVVDPAFAVDAPSVTLQVDGMRLDNVLSFITRLSQTEWSRDEDGTITIGSGKR